MQLKRSQLEYPFTSSTIPLYPCPQCEAGILQIDGEIDSTVTEESKKDQNFGFDPDLVVLNFRGKLVCATCSDVVFVVGTGGVEVEHDIDQNGDWSSEWVEYFNPQYFHPPLRLVNCPDKTPPRVKDRIWKACEAYFGQPDSCCNSLRAAAEEILTDLKIDLKQANGGYLTFSARINQLPPERDAVKALFDALRWLGNHGSHSDSSLTRADALDAFDIMSLLLEELYSETRLKAQELAKRINDAKGPVGRHS